jgi:hypothetical protein
MLKCLDSFLALFFYKMVGNKELTTSLEVKIQEELMVSMKVEMWLKNTTYVKYPNFEKVKLSCSSCELLRCKQGLGGAYGRPLLPCRANVKVHYNDNGERIDDVSNVQNIPPEDVFRERPLSLSQSVHRKLTLIRGSSFSLVELPTFLTSPVDLGGLNCTISTSSSSTTATSLGITLPEALANYQLKTKMGFGNRKKISKDHYVCGFVFF